MLINNLSNRLIESHLSTKRFILPSPKKQTFNVWPHATEHNMNPVLTNVNVGTICCPDIGYCTKRKHWCWTISCFCRVCSIYEMSENGENLPNLRPKWHLPMPCVFQNTKYSACIHKTKNSSIWYDCHMMTKTISWLIK